MKKIKLDSRKLILKKDVIGNLTHSEMKAVVGGETGYGGCENFTVEGYTCQTKQGPPYCGDWYNPTYGGCDTVGCEGEEPKTCWATQPFICVVNITEPCSKY
ncbi:class I lanthipeptide [Sphingobacterium lactis]|uniref:class I lanthipeptide n=1 Tax=Sphingobacterium lactis TaxID=797291 RepID=UPI003EC726A8